jgi:hypothetical protein
MRACVCVCVCAWGGSCKGRLAWHGMLRACASKGARIVVVHRPAAAAVLRHMPCRPPPAQKVNHRGKFSDEFKVIHKTAPELVPWMAGVIPASSSKEA